MPGRQMDTHAWLETSQPRFTYANQPKIEHEEQVLQVAWCFMTNVEFIGCLQIGDFFLHHLCNIFITT